MSANIGVIGLGRMGHPMVRHLAAAGFAVTGFDVDAGKTAAIGALGATGVASPRAVAEASDLVIVVVGFDRQVMEVLEGEDGVYAGLREGATIAVASTVQLDTMAAIAKAAAALGKGADVIDIPICRGEPAAEAGTLLLLGGGEAAAFARWQAAFATFASDIEHLGALGAGQVGKLVNNMLLWSCIAANHEGLKLAAALGVDETRLREALLKSSGRNWALETWTQPRTMPWAEKDMTIVMHEADQVPMAMPMSSIVKEVVKTIKAERGLPTPGLTPRAPGEPPARGG